jgi:anti-sigma-K factor RskA
MAGPMNCRDIDELDAAFALGALEADERRAVLDHLATCTEPHESIRALAGAGTVLAAGLTPVEPRADLRTRLMTTIAATPQEGVAEPASPKPAPQPSALSWWRRPAWPRAVAIGALAATLVLAVAGGAVWSQLGERDRSLQAVAEALANGEAAHRVEGDAGRGFVIEIAGPGATLVLGDVAQLPPDRLYELWLIDAEGTPVSVGTFTQDSGPVVVPVEDDLSDFATFAVTVEAQRVDAPTSTPVMVGPLEG